MMFIPDSLREGAHVRVWIKELEALLGSNGTGAYGQKHAWWLLEAVTGRSKSSLLCDVVLVLDQAQQVQLNTFLQQIVIQHKPIEYCIGYVEFVNCVISVEPPVLIPRIETESYVASLIELWSMVDVPCRYRVLDMCTGSGCIGLAIAKAFPQAHVDGVDNADYACALALKNKRQNGVENFSVIRSNLFEGIPVGVQYDCIISNPPYIGVSEWDVVQDSVKRWEDHNALFADDNGYGVIKKIIVDAPRFLNKQSAEHRSLFVPQLIIEVGHTQADTVRILLYEYGYAKVWIMPDVAGINRFVCAQR